MEQINRGHQHEKKGIALVTILSSPDFWSLNTFSPGASISHYTHFVSSKNFCLILCQILRRAMCICISTTLSCAGPLHYLLWNTSYCMFKCWQRNCSNGHLKKMPQVTQIILQKEPKQQQNTSATLPPTSAVDCYNIKGQNDL